MHIRTLYYIIVIILVNSKYTHGISSFRLPNTTNTTPTTTMADRITHPGLPLNSEVVASSECTSQFQAHRHEVMSVTPVVSTTSLQSVQKHCLYSELTKTHTITTMYTID